MDSDQFAREVRLQCVADAVNLDAAPPGGYNEHM